MRTLIESTTESYRWYHYALLVLLASFPVISVSVPSGGSGIYTFLVLPALMFGWFGWHQLDSMEKQWVIALVLLFVIASLSLIYSEDFSDGVKRLERYFRLMTIPLIYLMVRRFNVEAGKFLLIGVAIASVSLAIQAYVLTQHFNMVRAQGLYHPIIFGDMAALTAAILSAALFTIVRQRWLKWVTIVCIFCALYAVVASVTRGAWLLIPVYITLFGWLYRKKIDTGQWLKMGTILMIIIATLIIWTPKKIELGIERGYSDLIGFIINPGKESSWGARINMWRNSTIMWSESPMVGTGIGDFKHDSQQLIDQGKSWSIHVGKYDHAHSIYFDASATLGLLGLIMLVIALFIIPWKIFMRAWKEADTPAIRFYSLSGLLVVASFTFFGLTEGWLTRNPFINPYIIYLIVFLSSIKIRTAMQR